MQRVRCIKGSTRKPASKWIWAAVTSCALNVNSGKRRSGLRTLKKLGKGRPSRQGRGDVEQRRIEQESRRQQRRSIAFSYTRYLRQGTISGVQNKSRTKDLQRSPSITYQHEQTTNRPKTQVLSTDLLLFQIVMTSLQETLPHIRRHCLVLSFEILEPVLDKCDRLPMDLLNLGRFLARILQPIFVPVMHPIYHGLFVFPREREEMTSRNDDGPMLTRAVV